jgi:DNA-binding CsgD family transcriptional regulator
MAGYNMSRADLQDSDDLIGSVDSTTHTGSTPLVGFRRTTGFRCFALTTALIMSFLGYWLLNYYVFPLCDEMFIWTREISAASGGLTLAALALTAAWRPKPFNQRNLVFVIICALLGGSMLFVFGLFFQSMTALLIGTWLSTVGCGLVSILVGIACVSLNARTAGVCIAIAYFVAYALRFLSLNISVGLGVISYVVLPVVALGLSLASLDDMLDYISNQEAPAHAAISNPSTFLPFGSQVFISLVLFRFIYGFSLAFGEVNRLPQISLLVLIPLAIFVLVLLAAKDRLNPDRVFPIAVLFTIAGFLLLPLSIENSRWAIGTLLSSGVGLFEILILAILVALVAKNRAVAVVVFAWAYSLNSLSTLIGANVGRLANQYSSGEHVLLIVVSSSIVLIFVAYLLLALKDFSFRRTIENISEATRVITTYDSSRIREQSEQLGRHFDLTAREHEVLFLLARGRNSRVIQTELHISYNTAKAHVRHIYTKLGIHSQQELIDLVEAKDQ